NVQIVFDKTGPIIKGADKEPIALRAGEHGVLVRRGDFKFETDSKFAVRKGDTVVLRVEWLTGKVRVLADGQVIGIGQPPGRVPSTEERRRLAEWVLKQESGDVTLKGGQLVNKAADLPHAPVLYQSIQFSLPNPQTLPTEIAECLRSLPAQTLVAIRLTSTGW